MYSGIVSDEVAVFKMLSDETVMLMMTYGIKRRRMTIKTACMVV